MMTGVMLMLVWYEYNIISSLLSLLPDHILTTWYCIVHGIKRGRRQRTELDGLVGGLV